MNRKGQVGVGVIIVVFMALIVGLILMQAIAVNVEKGTQTETGVTTLSNGQYTAPAVDSSIDLVGQEYVSFVNVTNRTDGVDIPTTNYTIAECVRAGDGLKGICYTSIGDYGGLINVSYTYYPDGYMDDSGARAIFPLVLIFGALAIIVIVLYPTIKNSRLFGG